MPICWIAAFILTVSNLHNFVHWYDWYCHCMSKNHQDRLLALAGVYLIEKLKMIKKDQEDHKNIELKTDINLI